MKAAKAKGDKREMLRLYRELQKVENLLIHNPKDKQVNYQQKYGSFSWKAKEINTMKSWNKTARGEQ